MALVIEKLTNSTHILLNETCSSQVMYPNAIICVDISFTMTIVQKQYER